ncbi:hypothetical protein [Leifsonia aquatica]|uniref:Uncharacterized protein n=2 Tax=Leifsonia aquatica TaxID=144185 RepID=U2SWV8_LEIAQ|nr:hypothetical protein [Leifsonia aquatica]ERK69768.1 hypothetical protein N136_03905 [Leifsonia aquatica ATCC 14665]MBB2968666.1 hypothetical protein [Leifsonia aquatica]
MRRIVGAVLLSTALVTGLSGCVGPLGSTNGDARAHDAARHEADRVAAAIDDARPRNVLASDFAYSYSDASDSWSSSRVGEFTSDLTSEAIAWDGMTRDPGGARFVLRISAHVPAHSSSSFGGASWSEGVWSGCYAFQVFAFFEWRPTGVDEVGCLPSPPSPPPSPAPVPALPDDTETRLTAVLSAATRAGLANDLEKAFPDGSVRSDEVTGARLTRDSGAEGDVLGAAVGIAGTKDCLVGTRDADGTVHVRHPQNVTLEPGEAGCTLSNALHPVTTH